jgi:hypothetical protein
MGAVLHNRASGFEVGSVVRTPANVTLWRDCTKLRAVQHLKKDASDRFRSQVAAKILCRLDISALFTVFGQDILCHEIPDSQILP